MNFKIFKASIATKFKLNDRFQWKRELFATLYGFNVGNIEAIFTPNKSVICNSYTTYKESVIDNKYKVDFILDFYNYSTSAHTYINVNKDLDMNSTYYLINNSNRKLMIAYSLYIDTNGIKYDF